MAPNFFNFWVWNDHVIDPHIVLACEIQWNIFQNIWERTIKWYIHTSSYSLLGNLDTNCLLGPWIHTIKYRTHFKPVDFCFWVFRLKSYLFITVCKCPPVFGCIKRESFHITGLIFFRKTQVSESSDVRLNYLWQWALVRFECHPSPPAFLLKARTH